MGAVYLAVHSQIGKRAAIKVLHRHLSEDPKMLDRFLTEARTTSKAQHPGLVAIQNYGQLDDGTAYILMEYLEGETLAQRLQRATGMRQRLPLSEVLALGAQLADTLSATHRLGIIHRDLKPDNIFIVPDPVAPGGERTKILDFGIAKINDSAGRKTTVGLILGTPTYMAPEQCEGREDLSGKVDVYALGVMLFEMLTGEPTFVAESASALMRQHMFREARSVVALAPEVPAAVADLVAEMLRKDPAARPDMAQVAARLKGTAVLPAATRRRAVLPAAGGVLVLLAALVGLWLLGRRPPPPSVAVPPAAVPTGPVPALAAPAAPAPPQAETPSVAEVPAPPQSREPRARSVSSRRGNRDTAARAAQAASRLSSVPPQTRQPPSYAVDEVFRD